MNLRYNPATNHELLSPPLLASSMWMYVLPPSQFQQFLTGLEFVVHWVCKPTNMNRLGTPPCTFWIHLVVNRSCDVRMISIIFPFA